MANRRESEETTIAISGNTSATVIVPQGKTLVAIEIYADWTGTAISFLASYNSASTPMPIYDDGTLYEVSIPNVAAHIAVDPKLLVGCQNIQVKSNGTEAAARTILLIFAEV